MGFVFSSHILGNLGGIRTPAGSLYSPLYYAQIPITGSFILQEQREHKSFKTGYSCGLKEHSKQNTKTSCFFSRYKAVCLNPPQQRGGLVFQKPPFLWRAIEFS